MNGTAVFNLKNAENGREQAITDGKVRSAGVSCYYMKEIDDFLPKVMRRPVLVQNEIHPYYQDMKVTAHIQRLGIAVQAWYPLADADIPKRCWEIRSLAVSEKNMGNHRHRLF